MAASVVGSPFGEDGRKLLVQDVSFHQEMQQAEDEQGVIHQVYGHPQVKLTAVGNFGVGSTDMLLGKRASYESVEGIVTGHSVEQSNQEFARHSITITSFPDISDELYPPAEAVDPGTFVMPPPDAPIVPLEELKIEPQEEFKPIVPTLRRIRLRKR